MGNQLAIIEQQFRPLLPRMENAIPPQANLPVKRVMESILIACEREPKLFECTPVSMHRMAFTSCVTGLLLDGVTGQAFPIPFWSNKIGALEAQFISGYKGYQTIAGRSRYTLDSNLIYEGEEYGITLGTGGEAWVKPRFECRGPGKKFIGGFVVLSSHYAPPIVDAMSLDEILAIRDRAKRKSDSPWNNPLDFPEMAKKTLKRRGGKYCPNDILQMAIAVDDAVDQGRSAYIRPEDRAVMIDHVAEPLSPMQPPPAEPFSLNRPIPRTAQETRREAQERPEPTPAVDVGPEANAPQADARSQTAPQSDAKGKLYLLIREQDRVELDQAAWLAAYAAEVDRLYKARRGKTLNAFDQANKEHLDRYPELADEVRRINDMVRRSADGVAV